MIRGHAMEKRYELHPSSFNSLISSAQSYRVSNDRWAYSPYKNQWQALSKIHPLHCPCRDKTCPKHSDLYHRPLSHLRFVSLLLSIRVGTLWGMSQRCVFPKKTVQTCLLVDFWLCRGGQGGVYIYVGNSPDSGCAEWFCPLGCNALPTLIIRVMVHEHVDEMLTIGKQR